MNIWNLVGAPKLSKSAEHMSLGIFVRLEFGEQNFGDVLKNVCHFLNPVAESEAKAGVPFRGSRSGERSEGIHKSDKPFLKEHCQTFFRQILVWQTIPRDMCSTDLANFGAPPKFQTFMCI